MMTLRGHLLVLTLVTLLPVIAFAVIASVLFAQRERAVFQRAATERTRALVTAVDAELKSTITMLEALATDGRLDTDRPLTVADRHALHEQLTRVLRSQPGLLSLSVVLPSGQQVVNALRPLDAVLPAIVERSSLERVLRTGQPAVGSIKVNPLTQRHDFDVRVPVTRGRTVTHVLTATVKPEAMHDLLATQRLPADWVGVLLDADRRIVARTVSPERTVGQRASDSLRAALDQAPEGWFHGSTIEGDVVYTPYNRSPLSGWTVAMGIPAAAVEAGAWTTTLALAGGVASAGLLAFLLALTLGRRISAPIVALAASAKTIGQGRELQMPRRTRIAEVGDLAGALEATAAAVRAREEAQGRLAAIVQASGDAIISGTVDGTIVTWNPAATRLFGYAPEDVSDRHLSMLAPPDRPGETTVILAAVARGEPWGRETVRIRKDGTAVPVAVDVSPIRGSAGAVTGFTATLRDVTERRRTEEALREADRRKDEFLATLSHELRTPINAVYGWARMLQAGQVQGEARARALDAIIRNANAQVQLIDDLLDVSRIIAGKTRLDVRPVDLPAVIEAALDAVRPAAGTKGVHLQSVLDPRAGAITGDPDRLQQVVWNLLMNAVKFTRRDGRVHVQLQRANSHVEIVVSDTGQGIAPAMLPVIFDRFRQADSSSTRAHAGLGLGLALVRHLVELHGGTVIAHSAGDGKGATFTVKLPVTPASILDVPGERVHPTARTSITRDVAPVLADVRVLVVDDDHDALSLAATILSAARADVRICDSAAAALAVVQEWRVDVLIADIEMPGEDGLSLIRKVRALERHPGARIPAVALTAYGRAEDRVRTLSAGFSMHVPKPVDPAELVAVVASLIGREVTPSG
jgi:PAS domain S-box-containing protein